MDINYKKINDFFEYTGWSTCFIIRKEETVIFEDILYCGILKDILKIEGYYEETYRNFEFDIKKIQKISIKIYYIEFTYNNEKIIIKKYRWL